MQGERTDNLARRAWSTVLVLGSVLAAVTSFYLWFLGVPAFTAATATALLVVVLMFFVQFGYFVKVPERSVLVSTKSKQELEKLARYLCIESSGDSIELRRKIEAFISANSGRVSVWVAPQRLTRALRRLQLIPREETPARDKSPRTTGLDSGQVR